MLKPRFLTISGLIFMAALSRLIPHPWNATPVAAIALFAGSHFSKRIASIVVPLVALLVSDIVLGFHSLMPVIYGCFLLTVFIGEKLRTNKSFSRVAGATMVSSLLFFFVTNFACWLQMAEYPKTMDGLILCYTMALPFFQNSLLGDAFYTALLFGSFALSQKAFPRLQESV